MKIFQIVSGLDAKSGGPSYTVTRLSENLHRLGLDVSIDTLNCGVEGPKGVNITQHKRQVLAKRLGISPVMKKSLLSRVSEGDVIHSSGLWMMPNIYPLAIARKSRAKYVISPRGMLAEWSLNQRKLLKRAVGALGQNTVIYNADCIHVTAESEYEDVRRYGYKGPIALIPNGVDMPNKISAPNAPRGKRKAIFISRVHPKKGIERLLRVWQKVEGDYPSWKLEVCGPGEANYVTEIKQKISSTRGNVKYIEPVYGKDKEEFYRSSNLFILPTYSENFGVVVAEALSYEIPAIVTKGAPWGGMRENKCGWWIDISDEALESALREALSLNAERLNEMGRNGRQWMMSEFSWQKIAQDTKQTYRWLHGQAQKPECVYLD